MKKYTTLLLLLGIGSILLAQNTVGLLSYNPSQSYDGYNLMYPHNQPNVFLLNNCGEIVHVWEDEPNFRPGNTAYLTDEGLLYKTKRDANVTGDAIFRGGAGAIIEVRDWDNNLVWDYTLNNDKYRFHHDIAVTPEGTVLAVAWELKTIEECAAAGRDTTTLRDGALWPEVIFELDPVTDSIIWEWHAWDHLIQDFDSTANNYGVVADHPELIDVNYDVREGDADWLHFNSIDYNEGIDQILVSVPHFDELWIIDHTTTAEEAAGNFGGFSDRGGDLMYRWGNPVTYRQGTEDDKQLFFQHDVQWIDDHLTVSNPQYGKIALFNNQFGDNFSVVSVINPPWVEYGWMYSMDNEVWLPQTYDFNLSHPIDSTNLWSTALSGVQFLPNGNSLILSGRFGYTFELTPDNDIVWEYVTPRIGTAPATQGDELMINQNLTFRFNRFPLDFPAFEGRDLDPMGFVELEPNETFCDQLLPTSDILDEAAFSVYPNPVTDMLTVEWDGMMSADIALTSIIGQVIYNNQAVSGGRIYIDVSEFDPGIYLLSIDGAHARKVIVD